MRKLAVVSLFVACFAAADYAQSGRRGAQPPPTPAASSEPDFSESKPQPRRPRDVMQVLRSGQAAGTRPSGAAATPTDAAGTADTGDVIRVETNLITIPVSVFDRNGLYIPNLRQQDFKIFEDGVEQEIAYFGTSDKPFTVVLLIDTSPSTTYKIDEIRSAAIAFVDQLLPHDRLIVIEFDGNVNVLTEVTNDRQRIYKAIRKADFGYGTSLYDAVDFSLRRRLNSIEGRKAVVLFTDGVDTTSRRASYDSTLDLAEESDAMIFPIYYNTFFETARTLGGGWPLPGTRNRGMGTSAEEYALGKRYLDELAGYTGGRVFRPEATPDGLTTAFEGIAEELRRQYNIGYVPRDAGTPGQRKQIKVRVNRPNLVLRARDSYIVGKAAG
jgi:Ca-activated chloride channel homolog